MVNAVSDLLKTYYFEARYYKVYDNMTRAMDTLSELV